MDVWIANHRERRVEWQLNFVHCRIYLSVFVFILSMAAHIASFILEVQLNK